MHSLALYDWLHRHMCLFSGLAQPDCLIAYRIIQKFALVHLTSFFRSHLSRHREDPRSPTHVNLDNFKRRVFTELTPRKPRTWHPHLDSHALSFRAITQSIQIFSIIFYFLSSDLSLVNTPHRIYRFHSERHTDHPFPLSRICVVHCLIRLYAKAERATMCQASQLRGPVSNKFPADVTKRVHFFLRR